MRSLKPLIAACAALALILIPAAGASGAPAASSKSHDKDVLRLPMDGSEIDTLNPFEAIFQASLDILNQEYLPLAMGYPPDNVMKGALATKWKTTGDTGRSRCARTSSGRTASRSPPRTSPGHTSR